MTFVFKSLLKHAAGLNFHMVLSLFSQVLSIVFMFL